jgi:hypothetical protein
MPSKDPEYFSKHYSANREKILDYKKEYYAEKIRYTKQFKSLKLKDISKSISNHTIKSAISNMACIISANGKNMTPKEFYDQYSIKDFSIIEVEYQLLNDYELTINIPDFYLLFKN